MYCKQWQSWLAALVVLLAACGDDDVSTLDGGSRDGHGGASDAGKPKLPHIRITPFQAVASACVFGLSLGREHFDECTGFDKLEACARRQCDLDSCIAQCPQYIECLAASSTSCDTNCAPENDCITCMSQVTNCEFKSTCIGTFQCAKPVANGYCDELRACCRKQDGDWSTDCMLIAEAAATTSGEMSCQQFLQVVDQAHPDGVPCNPDASTPQP